MNIKILYGDSHFPHPTHKENKCRKCVRLTKVKELAGERIRIRTKSPGSRACCLLRKYETYTHPSG